VDRIVKIYTNRLGCACVAHFIYKIESKVIVCSGDFCEQPFDFIKSFADEGILLI
jgi:hypothetical protein